MELNELMVMIDQTMASQRQQKKKPEERQRNRKSERNVQQTHGQMQYTKSATRNKCNIRLFYLCAISVART